MRALIAGAALALIALFPACQTPHTFATPEASWKSHIGQLKYASGGRIIIGEVVVTRAAPREFQLEFVKGGSFRLLKVWVSENHARAEGVLARGTWQGTPDRPPDHLRSWLQLPAVFAAADNGQRAWTADSAGGPSAEIQMTRGKIQQVRLHSPSPAEDLVLLFQP